MGIWDITIFLLLVIEKTYPALARITICANAKTFYAVIYEWAWVLDPGEPLPPCPLFVGKAGAYQSTF